MQLAAFDARDNQLLAALPQEDGERWNGWLEGVELAAGQVLQEPWQPPRHAYFPLRAVVSLQIQSEDGRCDEVAIVGREGMVGVSTFMGCGAPTRSVVQGAGRALRLSAARIRAEFDASRAVSRLLLQYMMAQEAQVAQGVVCSRHHSIEQRLCLRLLQGMDLQRDSRLKMTHEELSCWLGVRRGSVTSEALKLQKAGLIAYSRGHITILDRGGLEERACECFMVLAAEYQRLRGACEHAAIAPLRAAFRLLRQGEPQRGVLPAAPG
ncbi:Crp/Fnr family transcriptional regulator [Ramlibacter sp. AN1133]|uniref:Crp/Fnr family transcriptional regulator n=1 Tax=Ramlibacter sp. AN1133 TaxID=3133429 RepID=UPI0030BE394E